MDTKTVRAGVAALLGTVGLLALAACDGGSASPARDHSASLGSANSGARSSSGYASGDSRTGQSSADGGYRDDPRREPVKLVHGKPMWAANRRHSADENAEYQFNRDGADFGAKTVDDFVTKVHAFVDHPPADAATLVRNNGDKLIYDPKVNVFAVVSKDGAPRTMFKPRDGAAYWDEQKERAAEQAKDGGQDGGGGGYHRRYRARNSGGEDDQG